MSSFETLLREYTNKENAKVHGVLAKCVDGNGKELSSHISGFNSAAPDAEPLRADAVFKYASATKLITSIALLQCIDQGLLRIDEPLEHIVPELGKEILTTDTDNALSTELAKGKITARHLLTHTSGLAYWFLHLLLMKWKTGTPEGLKSKDAVYVHERCNNPLIFEPGEGWAYGTSLDWAGVVVKRLHGGISLEDYMIENIWKKVGLSAPFPTFCISRDTEYKARLMRGAERDTSGSFKPYEFWQGDNAVDQDGGHGLSGTADDWLAVLADLVSAKPKLLKRETIDMMFTPQIEKNSRAMAMLQQMRPAWEIVAGAVADCGVNHGLGGLLVTEDVGEIRQPRNILCWGGAANTVWFASRDRGVAGFFSTQLHPFADGAVKELVNSWKKEFWMRIDEGVVENK